MAKLTRRETETLAIVLAARAVILEHERGNVVASPGSTRGSRALGLLEAALELAGQRVFTERPSERAMAATAAQRGVTLPTHDEAVDAVLAELNK